MKLYNSIIMLEASLLYAGGVLRQYRDTHNWIDSLVSKRAMERNLAIGILFVLAIAFSQVGLGFAAVAMMSLIMMTYLMSFAAVLGATAKEVTSKYLGA